MTGSRSVSSIRRCARASAREVSHEKAGEGVCCVLEAGWFLHDASVGNDVADARFRCPANRVFRPAVRPGRTRRDQIDAMAGQRVDAVSSITDQRQSWCNGARTRIRRSGNAVGGVGDVTKHADRPQQPDRTGLPRIKVSNSSACASGVDRPSTSVPGSGSQASTPSSRNHYLTAPRCGSSPRNWRRHPSRCMAY